VDEHLAEEQANKLYKAAKGFGTDEKVFIEILASEPSQLFLENSIFDAEHVFFFFTKNFQANRVLKFRQSRANSSVCTRSLWLML
jgi:hypothetical protein